MKLTKEQKEKLINEGAEILFKKHNGHMNDSNKAEVMCRVRITNSNRSDIETLIPLIEDLDTAKNSILSEEEFMKKISLSPLNKFRSAQFKKGMYAGYLETF